MFQTNPHYAKPSPVATWLENIDTALLNATVLTMAALAIAALFIFVMVRFFSGASRSFQAHRADASKPYCDRSHPPRLQVISQICAPIFSATPGRCMIPPTR